MFKAIYDPVIAKCWRPVREFIQEYHRRAALGGAKGWLQREHLAVFGTNPDSSITEVLLYARIGYFLQYNGFRSYQREGALPPEFLRNYRVLMNMRPDFQGLDFELQIALQVREKAPNADTSKNGSRPQTVQAFLGELFWANNDEQLSDEEIHRKAQQAFPNARSLARIGNVRRVRQKLNQGQLRGFSKPKEPIYEWDVDGEIVEPGTRRSRAGRRVRRRVIEIE